jgi:hypothetical protein
MNIKCLVCRNSWDVSATQAAAAKKSHNVCRKCRENAQPAPATFTRGLPLVKEQTLSVDQSLELIHMLEAHRDELTTDVSSYAKGRLRAWLPKAWNLRDKCWDASETTIRDDKLWKEIHKIVPAGHVALVTYGDVGIRWHRDDSYAAWNAWSIQLGEVEAWGYNPQYPDFYYETQGQENYQVFQVGVGDVLRFNPKNQHAVINPAENRWAINVWQVKNQFLPSLLA